MRTSVVGVHQFRDLEKVAQNASNLARITHHDHRYIDMGMNFNVINVD